MTSNVFIIHGSYGSPFENWFPDSYHQFLKMGIQTFVPHFPSPERQTFETWAKILDSYHDSGLLNSNSIFISHSSGCPFVFKYLSYKGVPFKGVVTVAGFNNFISGHADFDKINSEFFQDDDALAIATKYLTFVHSFYSENDPNLPTKVLASFAETIGAEKHVIANGGHFNESAGFTQFPTIIELVKKL